MNHLAEIGWALVGAVFAAGGLYARIGQMRKDINGIGGKSRRFEKNLTLVLLVMTDKKEDREMIARYLKDL
jgi:hypothetical protein